MTTSPTVKSAEVAPVSQTVSISLCVIVAVLSRSSNISIATIHVKIFVILAGYILSWAFLLYKTCPVSLSMTIPYCPTILTSSPSAKTGTNDVKIIINDKVIVSNFLIIVFLPYVKKITLFLISKPK